MVDMAEEKEKNNNNNIVIPRLGMVSDTLPEEQPDNTYRMALNSVAEDYDDKGALRTEESNALCIAIPVEEKTYHVILENCCNDDNPSHIIFESEYNKDNIRGIIESFASDPGFGCGDGAACHYIVDDDISIDNIDVIISELEEQPRDIKIKGDCVCEKIPVRFVDCKNDIFTEAVMEGTEYTYDDILSIFEKDDDEVLYISYQGTDGEETVFDESITIEEPVVIYLHCKDICDEITDMEFDSSLTSITVDGVEVSLENSSFSQYGQNYVCSSYTDNQTFMIAVQISNIQGYPDYNFFVSSNPAITHVDDIDSLDVGNYVIVRDDDGYLYCILKIKEQKNPYIIDILSDKCDSVSARFAIFFRNTTSVTDGGNTINESVYWTVIDIHDTDFGFTSDAEGVTPASGIVGNYYDGTQIASYEYINRKGEKVVCTEDIIIPNTDKIKINYAD